MDKRYNFYNLEASFKNFLIAGIHSPITIKNYMSDFRHFSGWLTLFIKSNKTKINLTEFKEFILVLNTEIINQYKLYLSENHIPHKTINRRLSTIRKFCSFCISQGWLNDNPAKKIKNLESNTNNIQKDQFTFLNQYKNDLIKQKHDINIINNYLNTIEDFLQV